MEPRTYANTPVGLNFLIAGYGKSAKFDVVLAYASLEGSTTVVGQNREREVSGLIDPRLRLSINFFGAPALSLKEFAAYEQDTIVGASIDVTAPGGQYDADKLVNFGTNRWSIKPELGLSKRMDPITLEVAGGVRFYTDNDDFFGDKLRSQNPVYSVQGHLIYHIGHGIWVAADANFYTGGQTRLDGHKNDDNLENSRAGVTVALPVNRYNPIKLFYSTVISGRRGSEFDTTRCRTIAPRPSG